MPGLLQTEQYDRALLRQRWPDESEGERDRRVQINGTGECRSRSIASRRSCAAPDRLISTWLSARPRYTA
ncbi:Scr1 family TA system antitoxin-like transcriptional regulator [Nocardia crassostreae]|uniref:Scr1 family TA system antitoxin-like transcriptional regulator n=1 Tax=Nocardia crassostreae TaxID=53428 RepID=UPI00248181CE|nr:Scr1 family TA system antitoxin-like transcriptional regulator [Nocardia crassostreae]